MSKQSTGSAYAVRGAVYLRVTISTKLRRSERLSWVTPELWASHDADARPCPCVACVRARDVQAMVTVYRTAGADNAMVEALIKTAASADTERLAAVHRSIDGFCAGKIPKAEAKPEASKDTIRGIGERWTSGELHRLYPDHVREKRSARDDEYRLETLCETCVGDLPIARLTLTDADNAMSDLDACRQRIEDRRAKAKGVTPRKLKALEPGGRRQYAQMISRICAMAVYPLKLTTTNPIPKGWLPRVPNDKAKGLIYPNEEEAFLADTLIPIQWRMFLGSLARLGFRADEAASLSISDVDLARGIIVLDENKTDDPRAPTYVDVKGFIAALQWWKDTYRADAGPTDPFFIQPNGERVRVDGLSARYRLLLETTLRKANLYRADLFVGGERRMRLRPHDLRGAFVTYALANGRTETWVMDRTGHRSSHMVNRYRRVARTVAEAELGDLTPLNQAIPEITAAVLGAGLGAAARKVVDSKQHPSYRKHASNGAVAQLVELRTFNP